MLLRTLFALGSLLLLPSTLLAQGPLRLSPEFVSSLTSASAAYACNPATCTLPTCQCATTDPVATVAPAALPQFLVVSVDDCVNTQTEALLTPALRDGSLKNPDGRPLPLTYYVSLEGCATGTRTDAALVKQRYDQGHEMAVHTRSHTTGTGTSLTTWTQEMTDVRTFLAGAGVNVSRDVKGFRAPYLATNAAMFTALKNLGFLYDSSILESPFYSPVSNGIGDFVWPYTYDNGKAQNCSAWYSANACPTTSVAGLWEMPLYYYVSTPNVSAGPIYYGALDVGGPQEYSSYPSRIEGQALRDIFALHFDERYAGNRAPMTFNFHAPGFDSPTRQREIREILASFLARPNVWAITTTGLIEWMRSPVPASQMTQWYAAYCQRHPCAAPTAVAADDALRPGAAPTVRVFPNPATDAFTVEAALAAPGTATVEVLDLLGRQVKAHTATGTDRVRAAFTTDGLAPGTYLVRTTDAQGRPSAPHRLLVQ